MNFQLLLYALLMSVFCFWSSIDADSAAVQTKTQASESGNTVQTRFETPTGFERDSFSASSFGAYLQNLPLFPADHLVKYYNGRNKTKDAVYCAVVDMEIGDKDLHQCADAVMHLRADYLRSVGRADEISFNFTNGFQCAYSKWKEGFRVKVSGNLVTWQKTASAGDSDASFKKYLETVYIYAGTLSLEKELHSKPISKLEIGDVFIRGGSPGHAVIVVDRCTNSNGEIRFMLAQSYMPAQEIQILVNPANSTSPWFSIPEGTVLRTPEWTFNTSELKEF